MHFGAIELNHYLLSHQRRSYQLMQKACCKVFCIPALCVRFCFFFLKPLLYNTLARALWRRVSVFENEGNTEHYTGEQEVKNLELQLLTLTAKK